MEAFVYAELVCVSPKSFQLASVKFGDAATSMHSPVNTDAYTFPSQPYKACQVHLFGNT